MRLSKYNGIIPLDKNYALIYNMLTGVLDVIHNDTLEKLHSNDQELINQEFLQRGYITEKSEKEELEAFTKMTEQMHEERMRDKKHVIVLTYNCNMRCSYCFEKHLLEKGSGWLEKKLTPEMINQIYQVVDYFDQQGDSGKKPITLFGGEPLLPENKQIVEKIFKEGDQRGRSFSIVTNGITIPEYLPLLTKYKIANVQITLDGLKEVHNQRRFKVDGSGTFDEVIEGIKLLAKNQIKVHVKVPIDSTNSLQLRELYQMMRDFGWYDNPNIEVNSAPVFASPVGNGKNNYSRSDAMDTIFKNHKEQHNPGPGEGWNAFYTLMKAVVEGVWSPKLTHCQVGQGMLFYDPFGDIYCCWESIGQEEYSVGKYIPELTFEQMYYDWVNRHVGNLEECKDCQYALLCGGGCARESYRNQGDFKQSICYETKNIVLPKLVPFLYEKHIKPRLYK